MLAISSLLIRLNNLSLTPRIALVPLPFLVPVLTEMLFDWQPSCFFNKAWYCIYHFHPPMMDVLFALLVLTPFVASSSWWLLRIFALVALSVFVHAWAMEWLVDGRGSIPIPGIDTIFGNVFPVAIVVGALTAALTAVIAGRRIRLPLWPLTIAGGTVTGLVFVGVDALDVTSTAWRPIAEPWIIWHAGIFAALYFGTSPRAAAESAGEAT